MTEHEDSQPKAIGTVTCVAYLGMSLDGFIAGPGDDLGFLDDIEHPADSDYGYAEFMAGVDALVMGRRTFETVLGFDGDWPYEKPIVVMSSTLQAIPERAKQCELSIATPRELVEEAAARGWKKLYIDGGALVTSFAGLDLLDELIVTMLPVALGQGTPVFGPLDTPHWFSHVSTESFSNGVVQSTYRRRP